MARTILIIDDNKMERMILAGIICAKYEFIEAENGTEAIKILDTNCSEISAILLDIIMPGMDGYEVLRRIEANPLWAQIPIIVCTALSDVEMQEKALNLGAYGVIAKPYNASIIFSSLRNSIRLRETAILINSMKKDSLTELYNRESFFAEAEKLIKSHESGYYIISCFDIESFKIINDQYGTENGDKVLKYVAECINECSMAIDGICCRFMADNFAALYPASKVNSDIVKEAHRKIVAPDCIGRKIKIRIGRVLVTDLDVSVSSMYDRATLAQESIKEKYDVFIAEYDDNMRNKLLHEQQIIIQMSDALKTGQFVPWFQPQYNHATGAIIGAEALVRWKKPDGTFISPGDFIPIFERNGFVYEVDKFMWEQACKILRCWIDEGRQPMPISVNISRHDIFHEDFFVFITGLISKYNIPVELLRLEVTESAFSKQTEQIIEAVKRLVDFGFTVEIDDFGSGYSSLNTLKDVPAQILKLDMRFMTDDGNSERGGSIIESIVRMAKWLGMSVIAEGVEEKVQADFLKSIGCYFIQGYYYSRPIPLSDYEALLDRSGTESETKHLETVEMFDNSSFWDPKSMDSLIFNSYVGGASIFEFHKGKAETLRTTDRYMQVFGDKTLNGVPISTLSPIDILDEDNLKILYNNVYKAIETHKESTCEVQTITLDRDEVLYIRSTCRVIAKTDERYLCYNVLLNISKLCLAEKKEREAAAKLQTIIDNIGNGITATILHEDSTEFLFSNKKYYELLGYTKESFTGRNTDNLSVIYYDDRERVYKQIEEINRKRCDATLEYRVNHRDGQIIWIRTIITISHFLGIDDPIQLAVFSDITEEKQNDEQLIFLNKMAGKLLAQPDAEEGIKDTLAKILEYFDGDRAYVFEYDHTAQTCNNTYEICAFGVTHEMDKMKALPRKLAPLWMDSFSDNTYLKIDDISELDENLDELRNLLISQEVASIIAAPMKRNGKQIGFIGIDNPHRKQSQLEHLAALGDYISVMLTRRDLNASIEDEKNALTTIMDGVPGGFARLKVLPDKRVVAIYFSQGFFKLADSNSERVMDVCGKDILDGIHPADKTVVQEAVRKMIRLGESKNVTFRIHCGNGRYKWVITFGKIRKSKFGDTFINVYFSDATDQVKEQKKQNALLDNLPCGAAHYEYDGETLTLIHLNKRFQKVVGRKPEDYVKLSAFDVVHPDDKKLIMQKIPDAISNKSDILCDIRILCSDGEYRPFHIIGRVTAKGNGIYSIYTILVSRKRLDS